MPAALAAVLLLAACASYPPRTVDVPTPEPRLARLTHDAVDRLIAEAAPAPDTAFLVTSVADLDNLTRSSSLGRLVSEEAAERLVQRHFRVPEVRLAEAMQMRPTGEFMLSHQVQEVRRNHTAEIAVTGTATRVAGVVYINLRFVRLADGIAVGAADFALPQPAAAFD
jgi:uncharacterized lipoprotein YajG